MVVLSSDRNREIDMAGSTVGSQLWAESGFADLVGCVAVGGSFEALAIFLIECITDPHKSGEDANVAG